jgi:hypothetical protein
MRPIPTSAQVSSVKRNTTTLMAMEHNPQSAPDRVGHAERYDLEGLRQEKERGGKAQAHCNSRRKFGELLRLLEQG